MSHMHHIDKSQTKPTTRRRRKYGPAVQTHSSLNQIREIEFAFENHCDSRTHRLEPDIVLKTQRDKIVTKTQLDLFENSSD